MKKIIEKMPKGKKSFPQGLSNQGISIVEVVAVIAGLILLFLVNTTTMLNHFNAIKRTQRTMDAELMQVSVGDLLTDSSFILAILQTKVLADSTPVNDNSNTKGIQCVRNTLYGANTIKCENKKIPESPGAPCNAFASVSARKLCWIQNNLSDHQVEIVPHPDPAKNTAADLIVDSRSSLGKGMSSKFKICDEFSLDPLIGNGVACPFRLSMYAWVECDGGKPFCGGGTGDTGKIRFAMIPEPHGAVKLKGIHNFSILDWEIGSL